MRSQVWLWRWRSNPLRRRSDVAEAWIGLAAAVALAVGVPVVGASTAVVLDGAVHQTAQEQQSARHLTDAVLLRDAVSDANGYRAGRGTDRIWVKVTWKAPDGSVRGGAAKADAGLRAGATTPVWTDDEGRLTTRPLTAAQATANAVGGGAFAAGMAIVVVVAARRFALGRLDRQRMEQWDTALAELGPHPNQNN